ncbi:hypothetical protein LY76DRAFT_594596 [Colletotrichum caudatum]|nr:hypothetical protein LY76DRAFT_594596 [Colletotrichum caudatum]
MPPILLYFTHAACFCAHLKFPNSYPLPLIVISQSSGSMAARPRSGEQREQISGPVTTVPFNDSKPKRLPSKPHRALPD